MSEPSWMKDPPPATPLEAVLRCVQDAKSLPPEVGVALVRGAARVYLLTASEEQRKELIQNSEWREFCLRPEVVKLYEERVEKVARQLIGTCLAEKQAKERQA